ncbi:MAG: SH3 domain-containing protein, partial [Bdellovibrionales bacterium]|nr:SH3 domain-containing protein [Bdellovibrionales bacterium]
TSRLMTLVAIATCCLLLIGVQSAFAKRTQYIQVKQAFLKAEPKSWKKTIAKLSYKDQVEELEEQDDWVKVIANGKTGYLHESALSSRQIVESKAELSPYADESDVVLAGKGFSPDVEKEYKKQHPDSRQAYSKLDQLESYYRNKSISVESFLQKGNLKPGVEG